MTMPKRALDGLLVIDFTTMVAGPACARALADCGAEVVKIETPDGGDLMRGVPPHHRGVSLVFAQYNAGKKSVVIDLKSVEGKARARQLVERCDVLVENFRPGVMKRLGLDYESVSRVNPQVVYCSISGFGQSGPLSGRAAYAPVAHAFSGFDMMLSRLSDPSAPPLDNRIMVADIVAGANAFAAIQTALIHRLRNGLGSHVDTTMMESMIALVGIQLQHAQATEAEHQPGFPPLRASDGYITIPLVSESTFKAACAVMGRPELLNGVDFSNSVDRDHLRSNVRKALESWTASHTSDECERRMAAAGVPCSVYNQPKDLFGHPHVVARGSFSPVSVQDSTIHVLNLPFKISSASCDAFDTVPALGEHTKSVFETLLRDTSATAMD